MLSNTMRLNFYLKTIHIPHPRYHPETMGNILKNKLKNKYICILMKMKIKMKMKKDPTDTT